MVILRSPGTRHGACSCFPRTFSKNKNSPMWTKTLHNTSLLLSCIALSCVLLLLACNGNDNSAASRSDADAALPQPAAGNGSVTGMPDRPGPGPVGDAAHAAGIAQDSPFSTDSVGQALDVEAGPSGIDVAADPGMATTHAEPTVQDALAVLRDYYAAINSRQYDTAYGLWSNEGKASGQTSGQFAEGFADTGNVDVQLGEPGRVDPAAGSRYIQIPVSIVTTHTDGNVHRYAGNYTLRRAVVDGASQAQRAWRIGSADIREVRP